MDHDAPVRKVIVLGGGTAGFVAAITLRRKLPDLKVTVIRSRDIGTIGVGEGSTIGLPLHLHKELGIGHRKFFEIARPTWKLGLRFLWGPRKQFHYTFAPHLTFGLNGLAKVNGYYCDGPDGADDDMDVSVHTALMAADKLCLRQPDGSPRLDLAHSYHFENEKFVQFLEGYATSAAGVEVLDDTVKEVLRGEQGVAGLALASGRTESADLYIDCSGFVSLLLGKTLGEEFISFKSSLFCDRAVAGGWARGADEPIKPYTTCETMDSGWCWQIEHEERVNRGYVYSSAFIGDEEADKEFRSKNPRVQMSRVIRFVSGRYRHAWAKNVVAVGNASGFVEPLEATAIAVICSQALFLARALSESDFRPGPAQVKRYNDRNGRDWDSIRDFIAIHYKFNTRLQTPFWRECQEKTDIGRAEEVVEYYREAGPSMLWEKTVLDSVDSFGLEGYLTLLVGQKVPYRRTYTPPEREWKLWKAYRDKLAGVPGRAVGVREALQVVHSPKWNWNASTVYAAAAR